MSRAPVGVVPSDPIAHAVHGGPARLGVGSTPRPGRAKQQGDGDGCDGRGPQGGSVLLSGRTDQLPAVGVVAGRRGRHEPRRAGRERARARSLSGNVRQAPYGTALLGGVPFEDPLAVTFRPTWPTFSKGFVVAAVQWPGRQDLLVPALLVRASPFTSSTRS